MQPYTATSCEQLSRTALFSGTSDLALVAKWRLLKSLHLTAIVASALHYKEMCVCSGEAYKLRTATTPETLSLTFTVPGVLRSVFSLSVHHRDCHPFLPFLSKSHQNLSIRTPKLTKMWPKYLAPILYYSVNMAYIHIHTVYYEQIQNI